MSDNTAKFNCPVCGNAMQVHQPAINIVNNAYIFQVSIIPSWSVEERTCRGCKTTFAPVIANQPQIVWAPVPAVKPPEEKRIIPAGPLPLDFEKRLKAV